MRVTMVRGLVVLALGVVLTVAMSNEGDELGQAIGLLLAAVGVGLILRGLFALARAKDQEGPKPPS